MAGREPLSSIFYSRFFPISCRQPDELSIFPVTPLASSEAKETKTSVTDSGLLPW